MNRQRFIEPFGAFLFCFTVLSAIVAFQEQRYPVFDEFRYLSAAAHLKEFGVFARHNPYGDSGVSDPTMEEAPVTPFVLAGLMLIDNQLSNAIQCILSARANGNSIESVCDPDYGLFVPWQTFLLSIAITLMFLTARNAGLPRAVCWVAVVLAFVSEQFAYFARLFLPEPNLMLFLGIYFCGMSFAWGPNRKEPDSFTGLFAAGVGLGLCVLTREGYSPLIAVTLIMILIVNGVRWRSTPDTQLTLRSFKNNMSGFIIGLVIITAPWLIRNALMFDTWAIVDGHGAHVIVERISYNLMTWTEWFAAWVFWLPDFGDKLGPALFGAENVERLRWHTDTSFYQIGNSQMQVKIAEELAGTSQSKLEYVVSTYILGDLSKHVAVTFVLSWRGLWIGDYFGLFGHLFAVIGWVLMARRTDWPFVMALTLPVFFMVGLHGFVSVSIPRYNLAMLPYLCVFSALTLFIAYESVRKRVMRSRGTPTISSKRN